MDTKNREYFEWLCRTCMYEIAETAITIHQSDRRWICIFDRAEEFGGISIAELLTNMMPQIEVNQEDDLPKKICNKCMQQLTIVHHFQQLCIQSDREMREIISKNIANLNESVSDTQSEEIPNFDNIDQRNEVESVDSLSEQEQIGRTDPLHNGAAVKKCKDSQEDVNNCVKKKACGNIDEYLTKDNAQEIIDSAIDVKNKVVAEMTRQSIENVCAICNKKFAKSRYLQCHLKRHTASGEDKDSFKHTCSICNKKFTQSRFLENHLKRHEGKKKTSTPEHSTEARWKKHRKKYLCEICKKTIIYRSATTIQNHIRTHTGERPFLCPECGKSFTTAGCMREHRLRHGNEKSYECPYCPARFYCSADIFKHKITHKTIKKHICDICGQSFNYKGTLNKHKRYHSGQRPYKCDYCEMCFVRADTQRRHMLTHTGEKPFKCKYCDRAFAQQNDQVKHLRTHLGENVYGCTLCPSAFRSASERRIHFTIHKNEDEETRERNMKALKDKEAELQLKFLKNETKQQFVEDSNQQVQANITVSK